MENKNLKAKILELKSMYVICKKCGRKFNVFPPSGDLHLGGQDVHLGSGSIEVNSISFGPGGKLSFGPGGKAIFRNPPPPKYRCPHCGLEAEYSQSDIRKD